MWSTVEFIKVLEYLWDYGTGFTIDKKLNDTILNKNFKIESVALQL